MKTVSAGTGPAPALGLTVTTSSLSGTATHHPLPPRPSFAANADSIGFGAKQTAQSVLNIPAAAQALAGSNRDVVANRAAIRMANMSAAEMLKAELAGAQPVKPNQSLAVKPVFTPDVTMISADDEFPGLGGQDTPQDVELADDRPDVDADGDLDPDNSSANTVAVSTNDVDNFLAGVKRKIEEVEEDTINNGLGSDEDEAPDDAVVAPKALKVNADGTVEQEDTIKYVKLLLNILHPPFNIVHRLWEPGYRERYYRQKFGVELNDVEFKKTWVFHLLNFSPSC